MILERFADWPQRLAQFFLERRAQPFRWGKNDCGLFAADAVLAITGVDLAADLRQTYRTEHESKWIVGDGLEELAVRIAAAHDIPQETNWRLARRGDVVLGELALGPTLGVVGLDGMTVCFPGAEGLRSLPLAGLRVKYVWRIG